LIKAKHLNFVFLCIVFLLQVAFYSCGASSTVRYNKDKENVEKENSKEDFDITPFKTQIDIKGKLSTETVPSQIKPWYGYEDNDSSSSALKKIVGITNGFRVQVLTTDNLNEADSLKTELAEKTVQKNIYVIFDPPFYKVEIGDFTRMQDAKDLNFKLNQMGYAESRVIASTVNVFE
jgi:SPOR domain